MLLASRRDSLYPVSWRERRIAKRDPGQPDYSVVHEDSTFGIGVGVGWGGLLRR